MCIRDSVLVHEADDVIPFNIYRTVSDIDANALLLQSYINWQHRFNEKLTLNSGLHSQHFFLTKSHFIEPRLGLKYGLNTKHTINLGSGLHSQLQPITIYFVEEEIDNMPTYPNQSLGFSKAFHSVLGHDFLIGRDMRLKSEIYYQYVFEIPVDEDTTSSFSMPVSYTHLTLPTIA